MSRYDRLLVFPIYSKKYCREHQLAYRTENNAVADYISNLNLEDYVGPHQPYEVVVLADSGYDDKKIFMAGIHGHSVVEVYGLIYGFWLTWKAKPEAWNRL